MEESKKKEEIYLSVENQGYCKVCGEFTDLRFGVCFDCSEFVVTDGKEAWHIDDSSNKWVIKH